MGKVRSIHNKLRSAILGIATFLLGWLLPDMRWFSHDLAAWLIAFCLAVITYWLLTTESLLKWTNKWRKRNLFIGIICLMVFLVSGYLIAQQPPPYDMEGAFKRMELKIDNINDEISLNNVFDLIESAKGIIETGNGKISFLVPIEKNISLIGNVSYGSKQTITGFTISDNPIFYRIPNHVYGILFIETNNERYEVTLIVNKQDNSSFTLTVYPESQQDITFVVPSTPGFFKQKIDAPIRNKLSKSIFQELPIVIQMECAK